MLTGWGTHIAVRLAVAVGQRGLRPGGGGEGAGERELAEVEKEG